MAQAASTMNQSDIRGLAFRPEPTWIFSVASLAFFFREFSPPAASLSHSWFANSFFRAHAIEMPHCVVFCVYPLLHMLYCYSRPAPFNCMRLC